MGGNDAGFSTIVQACFVSITRTAAACRAAVDTARALVPTIRQRLIDDVAALRARGLRSDARILQLGYPWLQLDNDFVLPDPAAPLTPYPAGDAVRSLITDATAALATVPAAVNATNPGQMRFVDGVTTAFSGHEPDARLTNPQTWVNESFSGVDTNLWYHPNDLGHTAYAGLLLAGGTWGAPTQDDPVDAGPTTRPLRLLRRRPLPRRAPGPPPALRVRPVARRVVRGSAGHPACPRPPLRRRRPGRARGRPAGRHPRRAGAPRAPHDRGRPPAPEGARPGPRRAARSWSPTATRTHRGCATGSGSGS